MYMHIFFIGYCESSDIEFREFQGHTERMHVTNNAHANVKFPGNSRMDGNTRGATETAYSRVGLPNQAYTNPGQSAHIDCDDDAVISNHKFPKIRREFPGFDG